MPVAKHGCVVELAVGGGVADRIDRDEEAIATSDACPVGAGAALQRTVVLRAANNLATGRRQTRAAVKLRDTEIVVQVIPSRGAVGAGRINIAGAIQPAIVTKINAAIGGTEIGRRDNRMVIGVRLRQPRTRGLPGADLGEIVAAIVGSVQVEPSRHHNTGVGRVNPDGVVVVALL